MLYPIKHRHKACVSIPCIKQYLTIQVNARHCGASLTQCVVYVHALMVPHDQVMTGSSTYTAW